ncbi:FtsX-like permease family protein [Pedobacter sp. MC2016-24]|uniref:ABC transporter permease n=1 Tax=Pedobacter sp. MC2016-24 TaxID=2780090 RepID=UPI00188132AE|nr:FtsX-like permease family protein [Pedobacter sp. MC2016-24]MBE9602759.1 ABC transporter permease [Pedobacter sp. MC2016-24]
MFRLNLKIALRNLWENKGFALISIAGLGLALAIFMLAMLYANYERSYDSWNNGYENIYRVNYKSPDENVALSPGNMATTSKEKIAAVAAATRIQDYWRGELLLKTKHRDLYVKDVLIADSNFFKVFNYPLLYGNADKVLNTPNSVIISKALCESIYGKGVNPVGEAIMLDQKTGYIVDGVIDVARYPSHFRFNMIRRFKKSASDDFSSNNYYTYVKLQPNADLTLTTALLNRNRQELLNRELSKVPDAEKAGFHEFITSNQLYLHAVKDIHLNKSNVEYEFSGNGTGRYLYLMLVVAALVLIIAAVNFTNLSVTIATRRAKETGIRKVLGASKFQIGFQFILETAVQCLISLVIGLVILELLLPSFNVLVDRSIILGKWSDYNEIIAQVMLVLLLVTVIVGLYPALLISHIAPAKVLKGNFSTSNRGFLIRNGLIVLQFFIAVLFISGVWVINKQLTYMQNKDLGYKPAQVLALTLMQDFSDQHYRDIKNTLGAIEGVNLISRADHLPGEDMGGNSYGNGGSTYNANFITVDVDYFKTMGLTMLEGRPYLVENKSDTLSSLILTQAAAKSFRLENPVGKTLKFRGKDVNVIGLVKDFNHYSPEKNYQPIVFQYANGNPFLYVLVNISATHTKETIADIEAAWQKLEPDFPVKYVLLDKKFDDLLQKQAQLRSIIGFLSVVTIGLALMGIFAIAAFTAQRRSKEINIRKVLGASIYDILSLLNVGFVKLVVLANVIAWPIAYLLLKHWLNDFAFRIEMPLLPFLVSGAVTLLLTIAVVSLQSYKAAKTNPIDALKYE